MVNALIFNQVATTFTLKQRVCRLEKRLVLLVLNVLPLDLIVCNSGTSWTIQQGKLALTYTCSTMETLIHYGGRGRDKALYGI